MNFIKYCAKNLGILTMFTIVPTAMLCGCDQSGVSRLVNVNTNEIILGDDSLLISEGGSYTVSGSLDEGQIVIEVPKSDKVELILDGADISCQTSAPIYIKQADKVTITLADGSENHLTVGGDFVQIDDNNVDAAIFSKEDLELGGNGSLVISCAEGNGITSKDDLVITGGSYDITAGGHTLEANDLIQVDDGSFILVSGKDGLHAENNDDTTLGSILINSGVFDITSEGDSIDSAVALEIADGEFNIVAGGGAPKADNGLGGGFGSGETRSTDTASGKGIKAKGNLSIQAGSFNINAHDDAVHTNADMTLDGGSFNILTGDDAFHADGTFKLNDGDVTISQSYEGIEGLDIVINGGNVSLISTDDGINAAGGNDSSGIGDDDMFSSDGGITITGGTIMIDASGDGIDSNGSIYLSGGEVYITGPTSGMDGALDYQTEGVVTGGIIVAVDAGQMAQNFSGSSTQPAMLVSAGDIATGELVVTDADDNVLISFTPTKEYKCAVISVPEFAVGEAYTVSIGGSEQTIELTATIVGTRPRMGGMGH